MRPGEFIGKRLAKRGIRRDDAGLPEARQVEGLRGGGQHDAAAFRTVQRKYARLPVAVEGEIRVDLIADDQHAIAQGQVDQRLKFVPGPHAPRRIVGAAEYHHANAA